MLRFSSILVLSALVSGCANVGRIASSTPVVPINAQSYGENKPKKPGLLYTWAPYSSAAVVDNEGNRCVLAASGAKTIQAESEADINFKSEIIKSTELGAKTKETLLETFAKLKEVDTDAAFMDIALFHLCILDQNGTFSDGGKGKDGSEKPDHMSAGGKGTAILGAYLETIRVARQHQETKTPDSKNN